MDPKPVKHSRPPAYPTRRDVLAGAASFALVNVTGGSVLSAEAHAGGTFVAPIFQHGGGIGATGCVVVSPPVFLSEEEALQVVKEELAKHGVQLTSAPVLQDLTIAPRRTQQVEDDKTSRKIVQDEEHAAPLCLTGMDEKRSIAIKLICRKNYERLGGVGSHCVDVVYRDPNKSGAIMSSVSDFDFSDAAQYVATEIRQKARQRLYVGVFYDPVSRPFVWRKVPPSKEKRWKTNAYSQSEEKEAEDNAAAESKRLLRQQAQDFAAWLKQQGAI